MADFSCILQCKVLLIFENIFIVMILTSALVNIVKICVFC